MPLVWASRRALFLRLATSFLGQFDPPTRLKHIRRLGWREHRPSLHEFKLTGSKGPRRRITRKPPSDGRALVGAEPVERTAGRRATANGRFLVAIALQTKGFDAFPGAGLPRIHPLEELQPAGVVFRHLPQPAGLGLIPGRADRRGWGSRLHGERGLETEAAPPGGASRQGSVRLFKNFSTAATE